MLQTSDFFKQTIDERTTVNAGARLIAEWNHNRYVPGVTVRLTNTLSDDPDIFPVDSIIQPNRPTSGVPKAVVNDSTTSSPKRPYNYRIAGKDSHFKYFSSSQQTMPTGFFKSVPNIEVLYTAPVLTNKVLVTFEGSNARPSEFTVAVRVNGVWTTVATNPTVNLTTGEVILWHQGGSSWTRTKNLNAGAKITGIRIVVTKMNVNRRVRLNVIEVSARLVRDISDRISNITTSRSLQQSDLTLPIGVNSANTASVEIDNADGAFTKVPGSIYGPLDRNVEFYPYLGVNLRDYNGGVDSFEYVPQGVYYSDKWSNDEVTVSASCYDYSYYLQSIMVPPSLFEKMTAGQIVSELLQRSGINNYNIKINSGSVPTVYNYYWIEEEMTLWDAIGDLCKTDQSAAYFDEFGIFQFHHRDSILGQRTVDYALNSEDGPNNKLSNIESLEEDFQITANKVTIRYKPLKINQYRDSGVDSALWNPSDSLTLRASELKRNINETAGTGAFNNIWLDSKEANLWPFESKVHINGEVMRYKGKRYWVYTGESTRKLVTLESADDKEKYDQESGIYVVKNTCTGELIVTERGLDRTSQREHRTGREINWTMVRTYDTGQSGGRYGRPLYVPGGLSIIGPDKANQTFYSAIRGASGDVHRVWGARMKFNPEASDAQMMGIVAHLQPDNEAGYYFELIGMDFATRYKIANMRCYRRTHDGQRHMLNGAGTQLNIVKDTWYQIDVTSNAGFWTVSVNGLVVAQFTDKNFGNGKHAIFVRSDSRATVDYFYAAAPQSVPNIEDFRLRDRISGGFVSGWIHQAILSHPAAPGTSGEFMVFDEFGSIVHEIREMDVEFEKKPALSSSHYVTNDKIQVMTYIHNPFRAKFELANVGRGHEIAAGDDEQTIPGEVIAQKVLLYGQVVIEDEEKTEVVQNKDSIRKNGIVEVEVDNKWIQTEAQARALGNWFTRNWSEPVDFISVANFGNVALQVGDLVSVNYPEKNRVASTHRYIVMEIDTVYDGAIKQDLTLRRHRL